MEKISVFFFIFSNLIFSQEYQLDQYTIGLWHLNENTGTIVSDLSASQANGTLMGNPQWVEGKFGSGILLDGIDDYISFQNDSVFNFGSGDSFSIEFWIKVISNDRTNNKIIFSKTQDVIYSYGYGYIVWIDPNNTLKARVADNTLIGQPLNGPTLELNRWYHIAFVRDFTKHELLFYVDGYPVANNGDPTLNLHTTVPFYIGRAGRDEGWESTCVNAVIDEIRISNTARVGTNLEDLYDLFPITKGNQYNYNYQYSFATYGPGSPNYTQDDSGKISYSIIDSTITGNKVEWLVEQRINILRHYITYETDTLFSVQNVYNFVLTESLNGNHELTANPPTWDSTGQWGYTGIWRFPVYAPNETTIPIYRFRDMPVLEIFSSIPSNGTVDSLWFDSRGLYKRTYYTEYFGNSQEYTRTKIYLDNVVLIVDNHTNKLPKDFLLSQNYPNPFNPSTAIQYSIPQQSFVTLKVYDLLGREVATLVNEVEPTGYYEKEFNASSLPSGVYFYRLQAAGYVETKKMILMR